MLNCFLVDLMAMRPRNSEEGSEPDSICTQSCTLATLSTKFLLTDTNSYLDIATNANGGKLNVMGIHHVKDAEISTSNANMLRIVVPMASRSRRSFVE